MIVHAEDDFDSDEDFRWAGDESGLDYTPSVGSSSRKSNDHLPLTRLVITSQLSLLLPQRLLSGSSYRRLPYLAVLRR